MGASDVQIQIIGRDLASSVLRQVDASLQSTTRNVNSLGGAMSMTNRVFSTAAGVGAGIAGIQSLDSVFKNTVGSAMQFAKLMETSEVGMAGILISMTQIDGRTVQWGEALQISKGVIAKLNDEALRTAATSEELVSTFRAILGPALNAKMTIGEIIELTSTAVNAVKSMMPGNADMQRQVVQEIRDLVQGGIQPASSTLATALGLKDSDIKAAKESSEGLFKFLMDRLKGFEQSAPAYARTWQGIQDQIKEGITRTGAQGMDPLFNAIKSEMADFAGLFVTINKETKEVKLNPELVSGIRSAAESAIIFGREMKEVGTTIGTVAAPAAQLLGGAVKLVAENAALVTYSIGGWLILSKVSSIYTDITAVTAGATAANTALGGAVLNVRNAYIAKQAAAEAGAIVEIAAAKAAATGNAALANQILYCREHYIALGVSAEKAAAMQVEAALHVAAGNQKLAQTIIAQNMAYAQSAVVADAAALQQVRGAANARTAAQSFLGTLWSLAGGWLGVALAAGIAAKAALDYFDTKNRIESYNSKAEVRSVDGRLEKKVWSENAGVVPGSGAPMAGWTWQELSPEEYREHYDYKNWRAQQENQKPWQQNLDDLTKGLTDKFGNQPDEKAAKKAERAYEEAQRLNDKIADMMARMNQKIAAETSTVFEVAKMKIEDEIANMKRDLDKSAIDFAKYGIDVSGVLAQMDKYKADMIAKAERQRAQALENLNWSTARIKADITGDQSAAAEAEYQATLAKIREERQNDEFFKKTAKGKDDKEARAASDAYYAAQEKAALEKRNNQIRDWDTQLYNWRVEHNDMLLVLEGRTQKDIDELNRRELQAKISYLDQEIVKAGDNKERRIQLEREKTEAIVRLNEIAGRDPATAFGEANRRIMGMQTDFADTYVRSWQDMSSSVEDEWVKMATGAESFAHGLENIIDSMVDNIQATLARLAYQQYIQPLVTDFWKGMFGGGSSGSDYYASRPPLGPFQGRASGGPVTAGNLYRVNEPWAGGIEVFQPAIDGVVLNASQQARVNSSRVSVAPSVKIIFNNNTGTEAKATAQTSWDSETQTMVVTMLIDAVDRNVLGARDVFGKTG